MPASNCVGSSNLNYHTAENHEENEISVKDYDFSEIIADEDILLEVLDKNPQQDGGISMDEDEEDEAGDELGDLPSSQLEINAVQIYTHHHPSSVFSIAAHPSAFVAVSGGEDDMGYIWDMTDGEVFAKLTGHDDSVTCVAWNYDGEIVSTGGMDGRIRLWRRVSTENHRNWDFLTEMQGPTEVMFLRWHPRGNVLLAGSEDSTAWLWQLPKGDTLQVFAGHTGAVNCGEFTPDGKNIISGCADGSLMFWNPRTPSPVWHISGNDTQLNLDGITSLKVNPCSSLAVVGGAAGGIRVVSLTKGDIVASLAGHSDGESIEAIEFINFGNNSAGIVATGATDGRICIWDLGTMRLRSTLQHEDAVTKLLAPAAPNNHIVVSASSDKTLCTWDARDGILLQTHKGHSSAVLDASLGAGGSVVVSAGDDGSCMTFITDISTDKFSPTKCLSLSKNLFCSP